MALARGGAAIIKLMLRTTISTPSPTFPIIPFPFIGPSPWNRKIFQFYGVIIEKVKLKTG
jgi:hypothetical protein